jgi:hypothetical protein
VTITEFTRFTQFPVLVDAPCCKFSARGAKVEELGGTEETSNDKWVNWVNRVKIRSGSLCVIPPTPPGRV